MMTPDELRLFRQRHKLTQAMLARYLNKQKGTIREWESGRRRITLENECKLERLGNQLYKERTEKNDL
jgi:DNA-binding transcriptional regulator YiaG